MDRDSPEPQPFDPARSDAPHLPASDGGFVLVVAASGAGDRDWSERAVTSLAAGWARQGRRVLLADLSLVQPGLHRVLGVDNREGVSDAFLFGSSIQKVARPVRDRGFLFVPAGTATARPDAVTGSPRWGAVIDGCARVNATLVAYLPSDLPGGETLLGRATHVVLLTDRNAAGSAALQAGLGERLRAVLTPAGDAAPDELVGEPLPTFEAEAPALDAAPVPEPAAAPEDMAAGLPTFGWEEPAPEPPAEPAPVDEPAPTFAVEPPAQPAAAPAADEPEAELAVADAEPAFAIEAPAAQAAPAEPQPAEPATAAPAAFDMGSFGEIEVAEPAAAAPALSDFGDIDHASATPVGDEMDLDLGALPEGGARIEEVPSFSGELAFLEPEAPPARSPEPAPAASSAWAPSGAAAEAPAGPDTGSDIRANDIPMREEPAKERPRPSSTRPAPAARSEPKRPPAKSRAGAYALLGLVVVVGVVGGAWLGVIDVPWLSDQLAAFSPAATAPADAAPSAPDVGPAVSESRAYAYSLVIESFPGSAVARIQAGSLNERRPDLLFVVAPVQVNGRVLHRLLAGPAADSAEAEELRATLATVLTRERPESWVVRPTLVAFNMGDREDLAGAAERVAELSRVDIPAYVLELPGRNAAGARVPRFRVYAGAYADEQEALYLRDLLVSKGFPDVRLVQRIGRHLQ